MALVPAFLSVLLASVCMLDASVPTLDELSSTWQRTRVCNPAGNASPCHGIPGVFTTKASCTDAGCCFNQSSNSCYAPNDQRTPPDPNVAYFAADQQSPSLSNGGGQLMAVKSGSPLGISCITFPPYTGECQSGMSMGGNVVVSTANAQASFTSDGMDHQFKWYPYQIMRGSRLEVSDGVVVALNSSLRMPFRQPVVMINVTATVTGNTSPVNISVDLPVLLSRYATDRSWSWPVPRPKSSTEFHTQIVSCGSGTCLLSEDSTGEASVSMISFSGHLPQYIATSPAHAIWSTIEGSRELNFGIVLTFGNSTSNVTSLAIEHATNFTRSFNGSKTSWEHFWDGAFQPYSNRSYPQIANFGGNLPTLVTNDDALARTYYMSVISLLLNAYSGEDSIGSNLYGSAGPIYGSTAMYIWDTTLNAVLFSLLEPGFLKYFVKEFVGTHVHTNYALDFVTNEFVGPWYAFNDYQLSRGIHTLAEFTEGDSLFNEDTAAGISIASAIENMATYWQSLVHDDDSSSTSFVAGHQRKLESTPCNLSGTWFGYWTQAGKPRILEYNHPVEIRESQDGHISATQLVDDGWSTGNGTSDGTTVTLTVYEKGVLHANLTGKLNNSCAIAWDNGSGWCRNGSSKVCTAAPLKPPDGLADYGLANNLLECVPTYIHKVPSLNAANVWLMRQAADMLERRGNISQPAVLRSLASNLSATVISRLYVSGKGYWACEQPDRSLVEVRHIIDFDTITHSIGDDLNESIQEETIDFVLRELKTEYWLRALSLHDAAAPNSDRKDHGPYGAYDGWLGETVSAFVKLGRWDLALNITRSMAPVYNRGPGGQSHQVFTLGDNRTLDLPAKAAADQQYFAISGAVIANAIILDIFGVNPGSGKNNNDWPDPAIIIKNSTIPRGFDGSLLHLPIRGRMYSIISNSTGVHAQLE